MWKRLWHVRGKASSHGRPEQSSVGQEEEEKGLSGTPSIPDSPQQPSSLPRFLQIPTDVSRQSSTSVSSELPFLPSAQRSHDRRDDPLGLVVLHAPPERTIDILFIHGLGGSSLRTWCHERDLDKLWLQRWLPSELPTARILTFGYNANFASRKDRTSSAIGDFATDLLFRMKYSEDTPERLGQVPIAVVAHSMGGLVFKKAYIQGHLNNEFSEIMRMIKAVLFLATPHRGTDLAETLSKLLTGSVFGHSPKEYVTELARRSPTIDDLNDAFRHHSSKLRIFSFYETLATSIGPLSVMIVDKLSAVMGYPNEISAPLNANHHNVCKFASTKDPNYTSLVGALRGIADSVLSLFEINASKDDQQHISDLLGVTGPPEEDLSFGRSVRGEGTCESFLRSEGFLGWLQPDLESRGVLWVHGQPGSGKSTLCSFVIERLVAAGHHCAYFFFKYGRRDKESTSIMLRSLIFQTALKCPPVRQSLVRLATSGARLSRADTAMVWQKLYPSVQLAGDGRNEVIYWVVDGLDEAASSKQAIELLTRAAELGCRIRILVFSRPLASIDQAFQLARRKIPVTGMPLPDTLHDIRLMVAEEIDYLLTSDEFKAKTVEEIVTRSQGNFLWASLVTKHVIKCHREEDVKRALDSAPTGMHALYDRMMDAVTSLDNGEDRALGKLLLTWAMYAKTPVTADELLETYPIELGSIMNLRHTTGEVCGQFVEINPQGRVILVHHSAQEYLWRTKGGPFCLDAAQGHEEILGKCLATLCDDGLRKKLHMLKVPQFLPYASTSWPSHLKSSSADSSHVMDALIRFFSGPYPLVWIQYLALSNRLSELFGASRSLASYVRNRRPINTNKSSSLYRLADLSLLDTWAFDLMKLPAKFGRHLTQSPSAIYQCIPALSPASSIIRQKFVNNPAATLSVLGLSNAHWDDCLGRVSGGTGRALRLAASPLYLAVASDEPRGTLTLWDTDVFDERHAFVLGEHIRALAFNNTGSLLACYAASQTYVWKVADWSLQLSAVNPRQERAIEFKFDESDVLMMVSDLTRVYTLQAGQLLQEPRLWRRHDPRLLDEPDVPEGISLNTPSCVAFNNDCTQIAVAYLSFALSIWTVSPPQMIARLRQKTKHGQAGFNPYMGKIKIVWHPIGNTIIGVCGQIFKWRPYEDTYEEAKGEAGVDPHGLACSPDGRVFVTMDVRGYIKIFDVSSMTLIYKLSSEDRISQVLFSPDSIRFYDLRGPYCNIWEPNCLVRLADASSEHISDTDSTADDFWSNTGDSLSATLSFLASESHPESKPAITAVEPAQGSDGLLVAYTNADGSINILDLVADKKHEIGRTTSYMNFRNLIWSLKHDLLAYSVFSGPITVKSVGVDRVCGRSVSTENAFAETNAPETRGPTRQLLFHSAGDRLAVCGTNTCQVLSLPGGEVMAERRLPTGEDGHDGMIWQRHPSESEHLLCFSAQSVSLHAWNDLAPQNSTPLDLRNAATDATADGHSPITIDAVLDSHSSRFLLLRTVTMHLNRPRYSFAVLPTAQIYARTQETSSFSPSPTESEAPTAGPMIQPLQLPADLTSTVAHAVGILPDGRLVFLDRALWVCTAALALAGTAAPGPLDVRRHFFIPHDWVTTQGLRLCRLLQDGTLLVPSKGEVAVLKGDLVVDY